MQSLRLNSLTWKEGDSKLSSSTLDELDRKYAATNSLRGTEVTDDQALELRWAILMLKTLQRSFIVYQEGNGNHGCDVWVAPADSSGRQKRLLIVESGTPGSNGMQSSLCIRSIRARVRRRLPQMAPLTKNDN